MVRRLFLAATLFATVLHAGSFSVDGELTLLRPSYPAPYTAAIVNSFVFGARVHNGFFTGIVRPGYEPGYRVGARYQWCQMDVGVVWGSWIHSYRFRPTISPDQALVFNWHPTQGMTRLTNATLLQTDSYKAESVDGMLGYRCCCFSFWSCCRPAVGIRWARVREVSSFAMSGTDAFSRSTSSFVVYSSDFQGAGPRLTFDADLRLFDCLRIFGAIGAAPLLSAIHGSWQEINLRPAVIQFPAVKTTPANFVSFNAQFRFGFGVNYTLRACWDVHAELGYEGDYYSSGIQTLRFFDNSNSTGAVTVEPYALDGWFFRLGLGY